MKLRAFIVLCILMGSIAGCSGPQRTVGSGQAPQTGMISKKELRDKLDRFEYFFISTLKHTAGEINAASGTSRTQRTSIEMQTRCIEALNAMTAADDSIVAFLDTWGLVTRLRVYFTEGAGGGVYGGQQELIVAFCDACEKDIERIGQLFLSSKQFEETKKNVHVFSRQNPIKGNLSNLVVYPTKEKKGGDSVFMQTLRIPMAPVRALEGVDNTASAIDNVRNSVERFTDVAQQFPETARWQMSILMDDFEEAQMTQSFLTSLETFSQSSAHLVEVMESMPQQLRTELLTVLNESNQQQLQTSLQAAAQTATQANEAAVAWKSASDSIQQLVSMFQNDTPRSPDDPPSFGMRDFDNMLVNAGHTADKVTAAAAQLQSTIDAGKTTEIQEELQSLIDHAAWRLFQLILAAFGLFLILFFIKRKLRT